MTRAEARQVLRRLVEEVAAELDDDDGAWLLGRWRRFDASLGGPEVHVSGAAEPEVRFVPVVVEARQAMRYR